MRVLLVDNDDSYTHNLAQLVAVVTGVRPVVVRHDETGWERHDPDAIVLSPGPGHPADPASAGICPDVVRRARVPLLGVCLGHQVLALCHGAAVVPADPIVHGGVSLVRHDGSDLFAGLPDEFPAVRYHSWTVEAASLPAVLVPTATTVDGVLMAVRHRDLPLWGVQFHPESVSTFGGARLLGNFLASARPAVRVAPPAPRPETAPVPALPPAAVRQVPWRDPEQVAAALDRTAAALVWLDGTGGGRFSYVGVPSAVEELAAGDGVLDRLAEVTDQAWRRAVADVPFGFQGGWVVALGYAVAAECGLPEPARPPYADALLLRLDDLHVWDHATGTAYVVGDPPLPDPAPLPPAPPPAPVRPPYRAGLDPDAYRDAVRACQDRLRAGDSYEVNLTTRLVLEDPVDPLLAFRTLRAANPAPYSAYVRAGDLALVCSSPERFLRVEPDGTVETKPIKGTAPRGGDPVADAVAARALAADPKSRAENLMVADLLRNDLGVVCAPGSVTVPVLMGVESYATVHQLVTTVRGRLEPGRGVADLLRATFPPGSMTGAPKASTMRVIAELEREPRGFYAGVLGWLSGTGAADLGVVIRTAVVAGGLASVGTGGGVVLASDPAAEHDEAMLKADVVLRALAAARRTSGVVRSAHKTSQLPSPHGGANAVSS